MTEHVEIVVVGAGPAGMAAATSLAESGATTLVLDQQAEPGGQIYRGVEQVVKSDPARLAALGADYEYGRDLVSAFRASGCVYWPRSTVWQITPEREVWISRDGASRKITTNRVILATGSMERPVPLPGWTIPGVMTVGALQILLKSSGMVVNTGLVLLGSGPLLYLFAGQCLALGIRPSAILETTPRSNYLRAAAKLPEALTGHGLSYLRKGLGLKAKLGASGTPIFSDCTELKVEGSESVRSVSFRSGRVSRMIPASIVAVHEGVIPMQQIARQVGCKHVWDDRQHCFRPVVGKWGESSVAAISIIGDGAGIGGARAAEHSGRIAAAEAAHALGRLTTEERDKLAASERRELVRHLSIRPFLDALYAPPFAISAPDDEIIACRCEEVTAGAVRTAVGQAGYSPDQLKRILRCGMGPCQGRMCGPIVSRLIADARGCTLDKVGYYNVRPPLMPLSLEEIAAIDGEGYVA